MTEVTKALPASVFGRTNIIKMNIATFKLWKDKGLQTIQKNFFTSIGATKYFLKISLTTSNFYKIETKQCDDKHAQSTLGLMLTKNSLKKDVISEFYNSVVSQVSQHLHVDALCPHQIHPHVLKGAV